MGERAIGNASQGSERNEDGQKLQDTIGSCQLKEGLTARLTEAFVEIGALSLESAIVLIASLSNHLAEESSHEASGERASRISKEFSGVK
jgi:hypothetical protein